MTDSPEIIVSELTPSDEPLWRKYVNAHPDATIYHTLEWRDILYNEYRFEQIYLIAKEDERVVGVLPMFLIKNLIGSRLVSLPFSIYGGPLGETKAAISALLAKCIVLVKESAAASVEIKPLMPINGAEAIGFKSLEWGAGTIMDMEVGIDALWNGFAERFNVIKGSKKGLEFILTDGEGLDDFYRLQLLTRKRLGLPTPSLRYYASFFEEMPGMVKLAIVEKDGKVVAGDIFFIYRDRVLLVLNVSDWRYRDCKPNDFMIWNIIKWCYESGYKKLDHGPVPFEEKGLLHYKRKWGGTMVNAFRYYYPTANKGAGQTEGSILFRLLPVNIAGLIGAKAIKMLG